MCSQVLCLRWRQLGERGSSQVSWTPDTLLVSHTYRLRSESPVDNYRTQALCGYRKLCRDDTKSNVTIYINLVGLRIT